MIKRIPSLVLCFVMALSFSSCIKDTNPDVPAYVYVPNIQFLPGDLAIQGSAQHKFTDAWISVDGQLVGVNNLPTLLPAIVFDTNTTQIIKIAAGISQNGVSSTKAIYPFFDPYEVVVNLHQGKVDTIFPRLSYSANVKFILIEDFESPGVVFGNDLDQYPDSDLIKQSDDVFEGIYSGELYMDTTNSDCYVSTSFGYSNLQLPSSSSPVYLEMHYKTNVPMTVGLVAHYNGAADEYFTKGGVNTIDGWNKIYFDITGDLYSLNAASYSIFLRTSMLDGTTKNPKVYVDNIRLVHY